MKHLQPRLYPDVAKLVVKAAADNTRSIVGEVNHALKEYYAQKQAAKKP